MRPRITLFLIGLVAITCAAPSTSTAGLLRNNRRFGATTTYRQPVKRQNSFVRERVPNDKLPQDGGQLYVTVYTALNGHDEYEDYLKNIFASDPGLIEYSSQAKFSVWNFDDPALTESHRAALGQVFPVVAVVDSFGEPIYLARGDEIPSDPAVLLGQIYEAQAKYANRHQFDGRLAKFNPEVSQMLANSSVSRPKLPRPKPKPKSDSGKPEVTLAAYKPNESTNNPTVARPYVAPWNAPQRPCPDGGCRPNPDEGVILPPHVPHVRLPVPSRGVGVSVETQPSNVINVPTAGAIFVGALVLCFVGGLLIWAVVKVSN